MNRWIHALAMTAAGSLLASCGSTPQQSELDAGVAPNAIGAASVSPFKDCGSARGVKVRPCPIHLNKHTISGIVVTVSGHHVVNSYLGRLNGCFNGELCYNAERYGSSQTQWLITSGSSCGRADVEFYGVDAAGNEVGYFFLKVANKYCP